MRKEIRYYLFLSFCLLAIISDETRGSREVLEILNKRGEDEFGGSNFPRLVHAMRIKEKKFVGHPHVQAVRF